MRDRLPELQSPVQSASTDRAFVDLQLETTALEPYSSDPPEAFVRRPSHATTDADSRINSLGLSNLSAAYFDTSLATTDSSIADYRKDPRPADVAAADTNLIGESEFVELEGFSQLRGSSYSGQTKWSAQDIPLLSTGSLVPHRDPASAAFGLDRDSAIVFLGKLALESASIQTEPASDDLRGKSTSELLASAEQAESGIIELPTSSAEMAIVMMEVTGADVTSPSESAAGQTVTYLASAGAMSVEAELGLFRAIELVGDNGVDDEPVAIPFELDKVGPTAEGAPAAAEATLPDSEPIMSALFGFEFDKRTLTKLIPLFPALVVAGRLLTRKPLEEDTDGVVSGKCSCSK